jgi:hypothetical protein
MALIGTRRRWPLAALAISLVAAIGLTSPSIATTAAASRGAENDTRPTASKRAFHDDMRRLWSDHVTWTRLFIVSFAADLPDLQPTTDRLLRNQTDIGDAIEPFYGNAAGEQLSTLLEEHILTAAELLEAAKAGDAAAFEEARQAWYANAREIVAFLHDANPRHWPRAELRTMMRSHLDLTLEEASDQLEGDYAGSVAIFDEIETEILDMADMLSSGIVAQFPNRFA